MTGEVAFNEDAKAHALAFAELSKMPPKLFPEGSGTGKSSALPAIWEKPEDFRRAMTAFEVAAADPGKAATTDPKAVGPAVDALGKTCKGCHDTFRKEVK